MAEPTFQDLKRNYERVSADLDEIGRAFMEGRPPGYTVTPFEIADWIRKHRRAETQAAAATLDRFKVHCGNCEALIELRGKTGTCPECGVLIELGEWQVTKARMG